jgi:ATP-binding cassette subfamily B protein
VEGVVRFLRGIFLDFMPAILTGLFALIAAITKQPMLGLVMIGVVPLAVFLTVRQLMTQKEVRMSLLRDCEEIDGAMVEQLSGMEYIRAAHTHQHEINRLKQLTEKRRVREVSHNWQMSLFGSAKALNEGFFHIVVLALATYLAINNKISFGDILTFSVLFLNVMSPLSEVHRVLDEGHEASLRVRDMIEMLEEPVDRSFQTKSAQSPRMHQGEAAITIRNLSICYLTPTGKPRLALDNISMQIRHGETIGVAGRSGSGKSTWIKVLLRLIHPSGGEVTIGGVPIDSVGRDEIGTLIGYVGQNPFVFSGTIAENIAYSNPNVTRAMIQRAAELAALHDEIMEMPHGYDTVITERGQNLSGGQRQRMAIARVLLKQAPILILDEATSALDNISERHVQRSLGITTDDRTTILIAHRLSTLRDCDRIIVFDEGTIAEVGTYTELVQRGGIFAELVMSAESSLCDEVKSPEIHLEPANEQRKQLCAAAAEQAVAS